MGKNSIKKNNFSIDFIGVGDQKSASAWIFGCLKEHPQICCSSKKETHFFDTDSLYNKGIEYYKTFFDHCDKSKKKGEFSPSYMHNKEAAYRIKEQFPNVKIIICLRNPIEKLFSSYKYSKTSGIGSTLIYNSFEEMLKDKPKRIYRNFYYKKVKRYFDLFGENNVKVIIFEDIKDNPWWVISNIYSFLNVDSNFKPKILYHKKNVTGEKKFRFSALNIFILRLNRFLDKYNIWRRINKKDIKRFYKHINSKFNVKKNNTKNVNCGENAISKDTRKRLRKMFSEDIKKLENLIDKDLSFWK